jgi:predicted 3-demethylubiquinone-9 3-methyltransferase (glyoxalase superfamily)
MNQKIIPCIWFSSNGGKIQIINDYYQNIFGPQFVPGGIIPLGETPSGYSEMCEVSIFGKKYMFMETSKLHKPLNDSISLMIYCENQS